VGARGVELPKSSEGRDVPQFEYKTEVLTSVVGRDKLRMSDLDDKLKTYGEDGWELVSLNLDADLKAPGTATCSSLSGRRASALPTALDNGQCSPRKLLAAVLRRLVLALRRV
jgi:hypothetical protein